MQVSRLSLYNVEDCPELGLHGVGYGGSWRDRLTDLFNCGFDFAGKTILDAGCGVGVIAYEISKRGPTFIHGVGAFPPAIAVARAIFKCSMRQPIHDS
jgi:2-polyprenyl-3-methyl-5-hydroxy-6-metoxy-1,4-benzoquinol methylase